MDQDTEIKLWDYIDDTCDAATKTYVTRMIATNAEWKVLYNKFLDLHTAAVAAVDLEQPSMRFTKNVMEAVAHAEIIPPLRRHINPLVIKLISGLFGLSMLALLVYAVATTNSQEGNGSVMAGKSIFDIFSSIAGNGFIKVVFSLNVMIGLLLLDALLRKRKKFCSTDVTDTQVGTSG